MALTNAERQARHRARLKERAAAGVTPDLIRRAAMLTVQACKDDDRPEWNEMLREAQGRGKAYLWQEWLPSNPSATYDEFGADAELMRSVAQVVHAVLTPPQPAGDARQRRKGS
jgi:hypothetical protein